MRRVVAAAALAAALTPVAASADVYPPPSIPVGSFCVLYWVPVYVVSDDVPLTVYLPRMAC